MTIEFSECRELDREGVLALYRANGWSSADRPDALCAALRGSETVVSAWDGALLVGLGNAISDGALVVYYPHLLVLPEYQRRGIGRAILDRLRSRYAKLHQQVLIADPAAAVFYQRCGFQRAGGTVPLWIYAGSEHG